MTYQLRTLFESEPHLPGREGLYYVALAPIRFSSRRRRQLGATLAAPPCPDRVAANFEIQHYLHEPHAR